MHTLYTHNATYIKNETQLQRNVVSFDVYNRYESCMYVIYCNKFQFWLVPSLWTFFSRQEDFFSSVDNSRFQFTSKREFIKDSVSLNKFKIDFIIKPPQVWWSTKLFDERKFNLSWVKYNVCYFLAAATNIS